MPYGSPMPSYMPQQQQRMQEQNSTQQMLGHLLSNAGMGIMGLSMKRPDLAMQAFGRQMPDPRKAMMEAAHLDMMTQKMAMEQQKAAAREQKARQEEEWIRSQPEEMRGLISMVGAGDYAEMLAKKDMAAPKAPGLQMLDPVTKEWVRNEKLIDIRKEIGGPKVNVNVNAGGVKAPVGMKPILNEAGETVGFEDLVPKRHSPEQAGKISGMKAGITAVRNVRDYLFPDGEFDPASVAAMNVPLIGTSLPWTEGRQRRQEFEDTIQAKLRLETGAAAPEPELVAILERYLPTAFDTEAGVKAKLQRLDDFFNTAIEKSDPKLFATLKKLAAEKGGALPGAAPGGPGADSLSDDDLLNMYPPD